MIRFEARNHGYTLSDHSLEKFKKFGEEKDSIERIKCYDEYDVFKALNIDYIDPQDREI